MWWIYEKILCQAASEPNFAEPLVNLRVLLDHVLLQKISQTQLSLLQLGVKH